MARILHVIANINRRVGGPSQSVSRLSVETAAHGHSVGLASIDAPELGPMPATPGVLRQDFQPERWTRPLGSRHARLREWLLREGGQFSLIHNHGLWLFPNHYAARAAGRHHIPLVVSPRGMLGPWALEQKKLLKRGLWLLREGRDMRAAAGFHATSEEEALHIRRQGLRQPIAVIPNGVDIPETLSASSLQAGLPFPLPDGKRMALFLSRIHPKKGLENLIEAWTMLPPGLAASWHLAIVGPDTLGYGARIQELIAHQKLSPRISLHAEAAGGAKHALLQSAELLILPTHEENFGIVVAEALAHGTPVITTRAAPWASLEHHKCGWWIPVGAPPLAECLSRALSLPSGELREMGERGRRHAQEHFSWKTLSFRMIGFYNFLLHGGPAPEHVRKD